MEYGPILRHVQSLYHASIDITSREKKEEKVVFTSRDRIHPSRSPCLPRASGWAGGRTARDRDHSNRDPAPRSHAEVAGHRSGRRGSDHAAAADSRPSVDRDAEGRSGHREDPRNSHAAAECDGGSHHDAGCSHAAVRGDRGSSHPGEEVRRSHAHHDGQGSGSGSAREGVGCRLAAVL